MGTRGSSSHQGGAGGQAGRSGRGQLAPWRDNNTALQQIMRDTGYNQADAFAAQMTQIRYYGADYDSFTEGNLPNETEVISEALMRMPYYNGRIWRGISVPDAVADSTFLNKWIPGSTQYFTDKVGKGRAVVQSFSSDENVAESFGNWNWVGTGETSIKFIMDGNKTAPGVQHISKFGTGEAEVLLPSYQNVRVERVIDVGFSRNGGRRIEIYLTDIGRKKK